MEKAKSLDITEEVYYEIIRKKTATLIASCCSLGAASVKPKSDDVATFRDFGTLIGLSFQIKDDLFDYGSRKIGKPLGIDIKEQKMTLPLIHALKVADKKDQKWMLDTVKNHNTDKKRVQKLIQKVKDLGGLSYAEDKMHEFKEEALKLLEAYEDSPYKRSLIDMVDYVVERKI